MDQLRLFWIVMQQDLLLLVLVAFGAILGTLLPATLIAYATAWRAGSRASLIAPLLLAWGASSSIGGTACLRGWAGARQLLQSLGALPTLIPWQFWLLLTSVSLLVGLVFGWRRATEFLRASQSQGSTASGATTKVQPVRITLGSFFVYQLMGLLIVGLWVGSRRDEIEVRYRQTGQQLWRTSLVRFTDMGWQAYGSGDWPDHRLQLHIGPGVTLEESSFDQILPADRLDFLFLASNQLTDTGLRKIAAQKELTELRLSSTEVSDGGIAELRGAANLRKLDLVCPQLTDQCLDYLGAMPNLESVLIQESQITAAGEERFRQRHPKIFLAVGRSPAE